MSLTINISGDVHIHIANGSDNYEKNKLLIECITQLIGNLVAKPTASEEKKGESVSNDVKENTYEDNIQDQEDEEVDDSQDEDYEDDEEEEDTEEDTEEEDKAYVAKKKALFKQICNKRKIRFTIMLYNKYLKWAKKNGMGWNRYLKMTAFIDTLKK